MAQYIPVSPNYPAEITPANGQCWTLEALQQLVGGPIAAISLRGGVGDYLTMYVNEDGLSLNLPVNPIASAIAIKDGSLPPGTRVVGDVIIVPDSEDPGDDDDFGRTGATRRVALASRARRTIMTQQTFTYQINITGPVVEIVEVDALPETEQHEIEQFYPPKSDFVVQIVWNEKADYNPDVHGRMSIGTLIQSQILARIQGDRHFLDGKEAPWANFTADWFQPG